MRIKDKYTWLKHLDFMIVDLVSLALAFTLAYAQKFNSFRFYASEEWMRMLLLILLLNILISLFMNPYSGIFRRSYYQEVVRAAQLTLINLVIMSVIFYLFKVGARYSREVFLVTYAAYFLLSLLLKYVWKKLLISRKVVLNTTRQIPLFIVGDRAHIEEILSNATAGDFQLYDVQGIHLIDDASLRYVNGVPVVQEDFVRFVLSRNISDVLISVPPSRVGTSCYETFSANGISVHINIESAVGFQSENQSLTNLGVYKTLSIGTFSFTPGQMIYLVIKRIFDLLAALLGLVLLLPLMLAVKLAYLAGGDTAPILYRQTRVGQDGREFPLYKFRSMVPDADEKLEEMLRDERYLREWEEYQKFEDDPRVTKVGKFLRRTSLDEFPQFLNVLRGEMSVVGPRPLVPGELEAHSGLKLYQRVKPGITGWWGCNGRSNIDYRERLELEYYYVKHCSLYLDMLCAVRTIFAVLKKDGAQ